MGQEDIRRISPDEAHRRVKSGEAMLVCGYEADEKFQSMRLEGAMSLNDFKTKLKEIRSDQQVIFYCA